MELILAPGIIKAVVIPRNHETAVTYIRQAIVNLAEPGTIVD